MLTALWPLNPNDSRTPQKHTLTSLKTTKSTKDSLTKAEKNDLKKLTKALKGEVSI